MNTGVTVSIQGGCLLKVNGAYRFEVRGTLIAVGTSAEQVIFTSYKDDSYGGDTAPNLGARYQQREIGGSSGSMGRVLAP